MTFFKLANSNMAPEIGASPQVATSERTTNGNGDWRWILPADGPIAVLPQFPRFFLEKRAKPTDLLSSSPTSGYEMISATFYAFMQKFIMDEHQAYPIEVIRYGNKSEKYDYFLMRFCHSQSGGFVDWERSVWAHVVGVMSDDIIQEIKFASIEECLDFKRSVFDKNERIDPHQFFLKTEAIDLDIFCLRALGGAAGVYVSERLKNAIEAEKITGCQFVPSENVRRL